MFDLWELEVLFASLFLGGLVAVVAWLVIRIFPKLHGYEETHTGDTVGEEEGNRNLAITWEISIFRAARVPKAVREQRRVK